jgi:DNA sulfur modification protein DndC
MKRQLSLWEEQRMTMNDAIQMTIDSLYAYAANYRHWAIAFSGGKDSTATTTLVLWLIESGQVPRPETLTVLYADTRRELPPLQASALHLLRTMRQREVNAQVVLPPLDERFYVYMLGRGVPPPNNMTFRWCTRQIKIEPMNNALAQHGAVLGLGQMVWDKRHKRWRYQGYGNEKILMLTGLRMGESAARDQRIALACGKDGGECGQGWYQETTPTALADTLAPLLHWRLCHVWDWLMFFAPSHGFDTQMIADVYGVSEEGDQKELNARTGCTGCELATTDVALDHLLSEYPERWGHLAPLKRLRPISLELRKHGNRLQKDGTERKKDGTLSKNPGRKGPLTMEARQWGLAEILQIQREVFQGAHQNNMPAMELINGREYGRIVQLHALNTWPGKWDGTEPNGAELLPQILAEGIEQPLLLSLEDTR